MAFRFMLSAQGISMRGQHLTVPATLFSPCLQKSGEKANLTHRNYSKQAYAYYDVLELTPKASHAQIKAAYYRLSKKYHPDVNKEPGAKVKFSAISEAYETLGNKAKKKDYDHRIGGHSGFTGFTGGTTDVDYQEFMRKQGSFKKRGDIPTGRTKIYNFDEFYRAHYDSAIKQKQASNAAKARYEHEERERAKISRRAVVAYLCMMSIMSFVLFRRL